MTTIGRHGDYGIALGAALYDLRGSGRSAEMVSITPGLSFCSFLSRLAWRFSSLVLAGFFLSFFLLF